MVLRSDPHEFGSSWCAAPPVAATISIPISLMLSFPPSLSLEIGDSVKITSGGMAMVARAEHRLRMLLERSSGANERFYLIEIQRMFQRKSK